MTSKHKTKPEAIASGFCFAFFLAVPEHSRHPAASAKREAQGRPLEGDMSEGEAGAKLSLWFEPRAESVNSSNSFNHKSPYG